MNIEITTASVNAGLRHVYSITATAIATATIIGLSQGDATALGTAIHQIGDGIASIVAGITTLIPIASALFAAWSGNRVQQAARIAQMPGLKVVPTSAEGEAILDAMPEKAKTANTSA